MDFVWKSHRLAKVSRLLVDRFFLEIFKIHGLVWIFLWSFGSLNLCFINVSFWFAQIFTLLNVALSKTSFESKHICGVLYSTLQDFKKIYPSKKPETVTRQLTKSIDFRQNYVCASRPREISNQRDCKAPWSKILKFWPRGVLNRVLF